MRLWVVFLLFVEIPIAGGALEPYDINAIWKKTAIDSDFVHLFMTGEKCEESPTFQDSCKAANDIAKPYLSDLDCERSLYAKPDSIETTLDMIEHLKDSRISKQLIYGKMLNAQLHVFDAHSAVAPEEAWQAMLGPRGAVVYSVGMTLIAGVDTVRVGTVQPGSPAATAGIQSFDQILQINDLKVTKNANEAREKLNSTPPGGQVELTLDQHGQRRMVKVPVAIVQVPNVYVSALQIEDHVYGYARIQVFREQTCEELAARLQELGPALSGLILDLRFNPGGRTDQAVCITGLFLGQNAKVFGEKNIPAKFPFNLPESHPSDEDLHWQTTSEAAPFADVPLVVLINQISASASEIVAAALQDGGRAWVIGERSFGKGSVQTVRVFPGNSDFRLSVTSALFYRPDGTSNELAGVIPNFEVPFRSDATTSERAILREKELNPGSLPPPENIQAWKENRVEESQKLRGCVDGHANEFKSSIDYQGAFGLEVLRCILNPAPTKDLKQNA